MSVSINDEIFLTKPADEGCRDGVVSGNNSLSEKSLSSVTDTVDTSSASKVNNTNFVDLASPTIRTCFDDVNNHD